MGTHPIFESDFDCLTEFEKRKVCEYQEKKSVQIYINKNMGFMMKK